jgi:hypothetical protein
MQQEQGMFVTTNFIKYHKITCKLLNNSVIKTKYIVNDVKGLVPCKNCRPDWEELDMKRRYCGETFK